MKTSDQIELFAAAMAAAQGAMKPAVKDATNPHFKSKYADLASVFEAIRAPLSAQGLSVWQELGNAEGGVTVTTRIVHKSGQWVEFGPLFVPAGKQDAQGLGSAATYARRYGLASAMGVCADEDDDGNAASVGNSRLPAPQKPTVWTIKAASPEAFVAAFIEKIARAPTVEAATKLHDDNKDNLQALSETQYGACKTALDTRLGFLAQAPAQAAE